MIMFKLRTSCIAPLTLCNRAASAAIFAIVALPTAFDHWHMERIEQDKLP